MLRQFVNRRITPIFRAHLSMLGAQVSLSDGVPAVAQVDGVGALWVHDIASSDVRDGINAFDIFNTPAAAIQATATVAAPGNGKRNLIRSLSGSISAVAAAQPMLTIVIRDGASGVGTIRWSVNVGPILIGESKVFSFDNLNISSSNNTALTVEFTAAPAAGNFESIAATGTII